MNTPTETPVPLQENCVYYDGHCPICANEINALKAKKAQLDFKDIHQEVELSEQQKHVLLKQLHLLREDGVLLVGLDANLYMWHQGHYSWLARLLSLPVLYQITRAVYDFWANKRYTKRYNS